MFEFAAGVVVGVAVGRYGLDYVVDAVKRVVARFRKPQ